MNIAQTIQQMTRGVRHGGLGGVLALFFLMVPSVGYGEVTVLSHVTGPATSYVGPKVPWDEATANVYIDPKATNWIGWSTVPQLINVPGQDTTLYLGGSVDDYFDLTITNPLGESVTVRLDANSVWGNYEGPQAVIFGEAATTPDAYRRSPDYGIPPNVDSFIDEAGAFNTFFTLPGSGAGIYNFGFAFGDLNDGWIAGHGDIYLLADVSKVTSAVPEPETWLMLLVGLTGLACRFRRRLS